MSMFAFASFFYVTYGFNPYWVEKLPGLMAPFDFGWDIEEFYQEQPDKINLITNPPK